MAKVGNDHSLVKRFEGMNVDIGQRLKRERLRLGKSQAEMADELGIAKKSQTNYELGHAAPSAPYLAGAARLGIDVVYVLTGATSQALAGDEAELLRCFRASSPELQAATLRALGSAAVPGGAAGNRVAIGGGEQGQVFAGDARQENVNIRVGGKKKGRGA
jgi:transcriptional regulator with XRE-family HTH domain